MYEETKARHRAEGIGAAPEDFLKDYPKRDVGLQRRWKEALERIHKLNGSGHYTLGHVRSFTECWLEGLQPEPDPKPRTVLDYYRTVLGKCAALLKEGVQVQPNLGEPAKGEGFTDAPGGDPGSLSFFGQFTCIQDLGNLLLLEAYLSDDSTPSLDVLERLNAGFARPMTVVHAGFGQGIADRRDQGLVRLALAGRLPKDPGDRWLLEEPTEPLLTAESLRGQRLLLFVPHWDRVVSGTIDADKYGLQGTAWQYWLFSGDAGAVSLERIAETERAVRAGRRPNPIPARNSQVEEIATEVKINEAASIAGALLHRQGHRATRLLYRLVRLRKDRGRLPKDDAEFREWLGPDARRMDEGPHDLRLRYESPAEGWARLGPDPDGPRAPLFMELTDQGWDLKSPTFGQPPGKKTLDFSNACIEARLVR